MWCVSWDSKAFAKKNSSCGTCFGSWHLSMKSKGFSHASQLLLITPMCSFGNNYCLQQMAALLFPLFLFFPLSILSLASCQKNKFLWIPNGAIFSFSPWKEVWWFFFRKLRFVILKVKNETNFLKRFRQQSCTPQIQRETEPDILWLAHFNRVDFKRFYWQLVVLNCFVCHEIKFYDHLLGWIKSFKP